MYTVTGIENAEELLQLIEDGKFPENAYLVFEDYEPVRVSGDGAKHIILDNILQYQLITLVFEKFLGVKVHFT